MTPDALVAAILSPFPLQAVTALRPSLTGELAQVAEAAIRRLSLPDLSPGARALLRRISAQPGSAAADLGGPEDFAVASAELLEHGLVTSVRFELPDCWTRTARGAEVLRALG